MISRTILLLCVAVYALACEQKNNNKINMKDEINSEINNFKSRPYYQVNVKSSGVNFDIRINDLPVFRFFGKSGGINMEYPINTGILESGEQILTVRVLPLKGNKMILPNSFFSLEINKKLDAWIFDNKREIILKMPKMIIPEEGIPYWEFQTKFNAKVPYQLTGWKYSENIENQHDIQDELILAYKKIKNSIEKKDNKAFTLLVKNKISEEAIALYEKQDDNINGFQEEKENVLPFTNCMMKFYGKGTLVRLEDENGESCLKGEIIENGQPIIYNYPMLFHKPKGSNELEVIR